MHQLLRKTSVKAAIASGILISVLALLSPSTVRIVLAIPLILFLPGYGITSLLFPGRARDVAARLLLSLGLSLATTAFSGLILHLTPSGIGLQNPWLILLMGGTGLLGLYFLARDVFQVERATIPVRVGFNVRQVLLLVAAAVIAATAVMVSRTPTSPNNLAGYTLFWVQPGSLPGKFEVGAQSEEFKTTKYQLRFEILGVTHDGPTFELKPGQTWKSSLEIEGDWLTGKPVTLLLYRLDNPNEVYRRVVWWYEND